MRVQLPSEYQEALLAIVGVPLFLILTGAAFGSHYRRRVEAAMRASRKERTAEPQGPRALAQRLLPAQLLVKETATADDPCSPEVSILRSAVRDRERPLLFALLCACTAHFSLTLFGVLFRDSAHSRSSLLLVYFFMVPEAVLSLLLLRTSRLVSAGAALAYAAAGILTFPEIRSVAGFLNALRLAQFWVLGPALGAILLLSRRVRVIASLLLGFVAFFFIQVATVAVIVLAANLARAQAVTSSSISQSLHAAQRGVVVLAVVTQVSGALIFFWILRLDSSRGPVLGLCTAALSGFVALSIAQSFHHPLPVYLQAVLLGIPLLVLMWYVSWFCLQALNRLRDRQWVAQEYDRSSFVWAFLSLIAWAVSGSGIGSIASAMALPAAVAVHRLLVWRTWRKNRDLPGKRLVLLRVFGRPGQAIRLLESLRSPWRLLGTIDLILGTDLAAFDVSPAALEAYLKGRLHSAYLQTPEDVDRTVAGLSRRLGGDGYYPIHQFHCFDSTWQYTVIKVLSGADAVLMDLRGFRESNRGCVFELTQLLNLVHLERILLLVDGRTDRNALAAIVQHAWASLHGEAPDVANPKPVLNLVSDPRTLSNHLLRIAGLNGHLSIENQSP